MTVASFDGHALNKYLGVDVLLRLALLDLEQRWARDKHEPLLDQRSLRRDSKGSSSSVHAAIPFSV